MDAGTFGSPDDGSQVMDIFNAVEEHQKGNLAFRFSIGQHISQICQINSRCHSHDALMAFIRCQAVQYFRRDIFDENALFTSQFPDAFQSRCLIACSQIAFEMDRPARSASVTLLRPIIILSLLMISPHQGCAMRQYSCVCV
jgi:hypothetical protein